MLQTLHLTGCSGLTSLPGEIGGLTALQTLHLMKCSGLRSLPEEIGGLTALLTLHLSECSGLRSLPEEIGDGAAAVPRQQPHQPPRESRPPSDRVRESSHTQRKTKAKEKRTHATLPVFKI